LALLTNPALILPIFHGAQSELMTKTAPRHP
jgi:hypothetical protein